MCEHQSMKLGKKHASKCAKNSLSKEQIAETQSGKSKYGKNLLKNKRRSLKLLWDTRAKFLDEYNLRWLYNIDLDWRLCRRIWI